VGIPSAEMPGSFVAVVLSWDIKKLRSNVVSHQAVRGHSA